MYIGGDSVEKLYIGGTEVEKVYLGTDVVYEKAAPTGGIHLTDDGMGIVFPAGTYTNTDGHGDFRTDSPSGSSQSDSITFDTDITFPSDNYSETVQESYRWNERNNVYHSGTFTIEPTSLAYAIGVKYDDYASPTTEYEGNVNVYLNGSAITLDTTGLPNVTYNGRTRVNFYNVQMNLVPDTGFYVNNWNMTVKGKGYAGGASGGSFYQNWHIQIKDANGNVKETFSPVGAGSSNITYTTTISNHAPLAQGDYLYLYIPRSQNSGFVFTSRDYGSAGAIPATLTCGTITSYYYQMEPKVVKLGLSGHIMDYSPDFVEKSISLGKDNRNGWDLGYVKFSGTEAGKLVQYSKTPIT